MILILHKDMTRKEVHKNDGMQCAGFLGLLGAPDFLCVTGAHVSLFLF